MSPMGFQLDECDDERDPAVGEGHVSLHEDQLSGYLEAIAVLRKLGAFHVAIGESGVEVHFPETLPVKAPTRKRKR